VEVATRDEKLESSFPYALTYCFRVVRDPAAIRKGTSGMATSLDFASGLPTIHTAMGFVESKTGWLQPHETSSSGSASGLVRMYS
jgi:hypothetical protein